jgi:hypothetical protein
MDGGRNVGYQICESGLICASLPFEVEIHAIKILGLYGAYHCRRQGVRCG